MKRATLEKISIFFANNPDLAAAPAAASDISKAEKLMGLTFNEDYVEYMSLFGGSFCGVPIHAFKNGPMVGKETVIELTQKLHETHPGLQMEFYVISDDGAGNPIIMNRMGEIFLFLHDSGERQKIYESLDELIDKAI